VVINRPILLFNGIFISGVTALMGQLGPKHGDTREAEGGRVEFLFLYF